jgi:hypothetical protein
VKSGGDQDAGRLSRHFLQHGSRHRRSSWEMTAHEEFFTGDERRCFDRRVSDGFDVSNQQVGITLV